MIEYRNGAGGAPAVTGGGTGRRIAGFAIRFNQSALIAGQFHEEILPQALTRSLHADVRLLWSHDEAVILGRTTAGTLRLERRHAGLYFVADLPAWAAGHAETIARRDVSAMSFGFRVLADTWTYAKDGLPSRHVEDLELSEVSCVGWPAYSTTTVSIDRAAPRRLTAADSRRLFRLRVA